jgi:hypothetical protein
MRQGEMAVKIKGMYHRKCRAFGEQCKEYANIIQEELHKLKHQEKDVFIPKDRGRSVWGLD